MVERINGRGPYVRRTHGSVRRGVFPVPSSGAVQYQQEQSRADKARLLEKIHSHRLRHLEHQHSAGLGNQELPAFKHKQEIVSTVESYKAIILGGETGSGKSTQVPQFLYEAGYDKTYVLVPRRVIADGLGDRIRDELKGKLGDEVLNAVGIVHGERVELHDENRIVVMTPDTFNGMLPDIEARHENDKVAIISDEIHEANLFTEIATGVAAIAVQKHDDWRLIASSATHNADTLFEPFSKINGTTEVPMVTIEGRPFNVELKEEPTKTPMEVYATLEGSPERTMIFTSGKHEIEYIIEETRATMEMLEQGSSANVIFRKLHGDLTETELSHVNDPIPEGYRLVIVSSPAGMSGITISGVTHVISDGTINRSELDDDGVHGLRRQYLSRAGVIQQIGRAGRDVPGGIGILAKPITIDEDEMRKRNMVIEFPHMPFKSFNDNERLAHEPAEIYSSNLGRVVLRVAALDRRFSEINDYIPHRVTSSAIISAEESLFRLGALNEEDKITKTGEVMNKFSLSPELSRGVAEAYRNSRTIQHLAHVAFIAATIEQGGLQDYSQKTNRWQRLIRPETGDDFIAQLDIALAMVTPDETGERLPEQHFIYENDLHPKKIERARKTARKILKMMRIDIDNHELLYPRPDEERLLRRDFTAGLVDQVYQETSRRQKKVFYRNIHGDDSSTERYISRSVAKPEEGTIIAGFPRWFEKRTPRGAIQHHDVVEQVLLVEKEDVIHFASEHGILSSRPLGPRLVGDTVIEQEQYTFGSLEAGKPVAGVPREKIPEITQSLIVKTALERQGEAQRALRAVIDELAYYRTIIPPEEINRYRNSKAPEDITNETVEELLREFAKETRSISYIDRKLAYFVYSKDIDITTFYDDQARLAMRRRSPEYIEIGGKEYPVRYDNGRPFITHLSREHHAVAEAGVYLADGREVFLQVTRKRGEKHLLPLTNVDENSH